MWRLASIFVLAVASTVSGLISIIKESIDMTSPLNFQAHAHSDGFVEEIGNAQHDLYVGHGFFQEQYYRLASSFGVYVGNYNEQMMVAIGESVDQFNREVNSIEDTLGGMNVADECLSLWETLQFRYGRSLASCADYGFDEIRLMVENYDFVIWWSEQYITNAVQTHAMHEFVYWNPLMYPNFDVIGGINTELRLTLDLYYSDYVDYIQYIRNFNLAKMDGIIQSVQTCSNVYVQAFQATVSMFLQDAEAGRC
jgi:hypothetical protein